jgi:hypothetical protein
MVDNADKSKAERFRFVCLDRQRIDDDKALQDKENIYDVSSSLGNLISFRTESGTGGGQAATTCRRVFGHDVCLNGATCEPLLVQHQFDNKANGKYIYKAQCICHTG